MEQIHYRRIAAGCYQIELHHEAEVPEFAGVFGQIPGAFLYQDGTLVLHPLFAWDGASGGIDTPDTLRGSAYHDALYRMISEGQIPESMRKVADDVLLRVLIEDGVPRARAEAWHAGTHLFGGLALSPRPVMVAPPPPEERPEPEWPMPQTA